MEGYPAPGVIAWHLLTYGLSVLTAFLIGEWRWRRRHAILRAELRADKRRDALRKALEPAIDIIGDTVRGLHKCPGNVSGYLMGPRRHALRDAVNSLHDAFPAERVRPLADALDALYEPDCRRDLQQATQRAEALQRLARALLD